MQSHAHLLDRIPIIGLLTMHRKNYNRHMSDEGAHGLKNESKERRIAYS